MRIIAGSLRGRQFDSPHGQRTHPMSEKARGALFNTLGELEGLRVLDAFAGSGALGFEAISRGANEALLLESDRSAQRVIEQNIRELRVEKRVRLVKSAAGPWLQTNPAAQFDVVLLDPPYDDLQPNLLARLATAVIPGGLLILSWPGDQRLPDFDACELLKQKNHGDLQLAFYRRIG